MPRGIKGSGKPKSNKPKDDAPEPGGRGSGRGKGQDLPHSPGRSQQQHAEPPPVANLPTEEPEAAAGARGQDPKLAAAEAELARRYPGRRIVPGSLRPAGETPGFGHKRTIAIECADCGQQRVVATSDLFHVARCLACTRAAKKGKKRTAGGGASD